MINGAPCRLLDIQELLSDTGIGRQQHVIVGQGQLDAVLNARPEDRRAIIEEAAGILKFRKRKEKAERRLEATEGNLLRLTDLLREVRRQLRPLERQADAARRHDGIVAELRCDHACTSPDARSTSCAAASSKRVDARRDLAQRGARRACAAARARRAGDRRRARARGPGRRRRRRRARAHRGVARTQPRARRTSSTERRRGLDRELAAVADEGVVETLVAEAAHVREQLAAVDADFESLAPTRAEVGRGRGRASSVARACAVAR